ncbi:MAG: hypothetical protein AAFP90_09180 [Planctomycetota bacterium]
MATPRCGFTVGELIASAVVLLAAGMLLGQFVFSSARSRVARQRNDYRTEWVRNTAQRLKSWLQKTDDPRRSIETAMAFVEKRSLPISIRSERFSFSDGRTPAADGTRLRPVESPDSNPSPNGLHIVVFWSEPDHRLDASAIHIWHAIDSDPGEQVEALREEQDGR